MTWWLSKTPTSFQSRFSFPRITWGFIGLCAGSVGTLLVSLSGTATLDRIIEMQEKTIQTSAENQQRYHKELSALKQEKKSWNREVHNITEVHPDGSRRVEEYSKTIEKSKTSDKKESKISYEQLIKETLSSYEKSQKITEFSHLDVNLGLYSDMTKQLEVGYKKGLFRFSLFGDDKMRIGLGIGMSL